MLKISATFLVIFISIFGFVSPPAFAKVNGASTVQEPTNVNGAITDAVTQASPPVVGNWDFVYSWTDYTPTPPVPNCTNYTPTPPVPIRTGVVMIARPPRQIPLEPAEPTLKNNVYKNQPALEK
jgi:hypothetical protein